MGFLGSTVEQLVCERLPWDAGTVSDSHAGLAALRAGFALAGFLIVIEHRLHDDDGSTSEAVARKVRSAGSTRRAATLRWANGRRPRSARMYLHELDGGWARAGTMQSIRRKDGMTR